jgi:mRNA interferase MazF
MDDVVLCQITSKAYDDRLAIPMMESDFVSGGLKKAIFAGIGKLFTANSSIVLGVAD